MVRSHREKRRAAVLSACIPLAILSLSLVRPCAGQAPPTVQAIGVGGVGQGAMEFLGRSDQDGNTVTHYGYLTHVAGIDNALLFLDPNNRTEATARFTYFAQTTIDTRHVLGSLIVTAAPGTLTMYLNDTAGASFDTPASFARGTPIATYAARYHSVLNVLQPNAGIASLDGELTQLSTRPFLLPRQRQSLGARGLRVRISATGQGTRTQADPLRSVFILAGSLTVTGR